MDCQIENSKKNNANATKILSQQIFHKSLFISRPRSNSCSGTMSASNVSATIDLVDSDNAPGETWVEVPGRKRPRSPDEPSSQKQTKLNSYWLSAPITTSNQFSSLDVSNDTPETAQKPIKPPPLFVDKVSNIQPLYNMLNDTVTDQYEIKILRGEQVKIQPKTTEAYTKIYKELQKRETEFYTYKPKDERSFRVVLKNIHPSTDTNEIKVAIEELDHKVTNIWNIKDRKSKAPLPLHYIDLKPNQNNKNIYNVKRLLHCCVVFEPPRPKREIPQCSNCQRYGHTRRFCHRQPRCVKCAGSHATLDCARKGRSDNVRCILCEGNHPANYKGCSVYKELQKVKYPSLRPKPQLNKDTQGKNGITINQNRYETSGNKTYAEITSSIPTKETQAATHLPQSKPNPSPDIKEFMQSLMNQMMIITKMLGDLMSMLPNLMH